MIAGRRGREGAGESLGAKVVSREVSLDFKIPGQFVKEDLEN
jgi:hypothetical protein